MKRLGVNIDHVATLRNARGEFHPDPIYAAKYVNKLGADSVTIHLREDRSCLLYTSPSPRDKRQSRMPSSA